MIILGILSIMTFRKMTDSLMIISKIGFKKTLSIKDTQYNY